MESWNIINYIHNLKIISSLPGESQILKVNFHAVKEYISVSVRLQALSTKTVSRSKVPASAIVFGAAGREFVWTI
jgi:hypothetical protein